MSIDYSMLMQMSLQGDLESFLAAWDYAIVALSEQPLNKLFHALLMPQLRKCKALGPAFVVYDGAEDGDSKRTF